ncbi:hypothetical protein DY000_02016138 [Brassica cretica]|uniref:Uncharacterized protein n=1 Tax=Brassica cretica TaxID=69181 RepID=A0ABQ7CZ86_BRACR|nr:hypothetical protein DY000_02016138 [Brassica cretica]
MPSSDDKDRFSHDSREIALKSRRECMDSCRIDVLGEIGCFVMTEPRTCSIATQRPSLARARPLCRDRVVCVLGRYRPKRVRAQSLRTDRAWLELGRHVATKPYACSVAT